VVPHRDVWIAVRLDLDDGETPPPTAGATSPGIHRALGAALVRVSTVLTTSGLDHRVLDGTELRQALLDAYGPDPYDGRASRAHETWSRWQARRAVHVCYAVAGWPASRSAPAPDVLTELARVPGAVSVCTAIAFGEVSFARRAGTDRGAHGAAGGGRAGTGRWLPAPVAGRGATARRAPGAPRR
jgi:hypothetical protein